MSVEDEANTALGDFARTLARKGVVAVQRWHFVTAYIRVGEDLNNAYIADFSVQTLRDVVMPPKP